MGTALGAVAGIGVTISLVSDIFRHLFFFIDSIIYGLIPVVYGLIYSLYDVSSFISEETLGGIVRNASSTIYSFLAIFMFFRVAFSLITMLVDPSVIDDKEKGAKKIVVNIMICLILIVGVPYGFKYAKIIQQRIISEKVIEKVVVGNKFNYDENYNLGEHFSKSVFRIFIQPVSDADSDAATRYKDVFDGEGYNLYQISDVLNDVTGEGLISKIPGLNLLGDAHYSISYVFLLSTIVGAYILWMFVGFMVDVAYRTIKFVALEIISPIAIVSYIDPASAKKGLFSKWLDEIIKTYASLFIRIFTFAIASVFLSAMDLSSTLETNFTAKIIFILAIVAFIKNAPKFIDNLFGTTMSKDSDSKFAKSMIGGALGFATAATAGGIANAVVAKRVGKNALKAGVAGAWNAGKKGYSTGAKGGLGAVTGVTSNAIGAYGDAKKKYGYEIDKEQEKLIDSLQSRVGDVNTAKGVAAGKMAIGSQDFINKLTQGAKVNGRKYGMGLENDEGLENLFKKNAGGLAQDELLHQGDQTYLELRRAVAKAKDDEAILSRVNSRAKSQYSSAESAFNSSDNKNAYIISFEMGTAQMDYGRMDENALQESFNSEFKKAVDVRVKNISGKASSLDRNMRINMLLEASGGSLDINAISNMSDSAISSEYERLIRTNVENEFNKEGFVEKFNAATTQEAKMDIALELKQNNIQYEVSNISGADLTDRFDKANEERIIATYGQSITNIDNDAGKASGDAKKAQEALDQYLKSGNGKKAKNIDSAYAIADSRQKAKELEEKRQNNS